MKSKGGQVKKANYSTVVIRIPTPIVGEVQRLTEEFYETVNIGKSIGIESLNLSTKCFRILKRLQINTVDDLLALSDVGSNLTHVAGLGKKSLKAIEDALLKYR